ncbi:hypothetical protein GCM10027075_53110 [Streptomyces heilongjiangensis]
MFARTFRRAVAGEVTDTMIGLRGGDHVAQKCVRVEICIAVADWATGPVTSVLVVPGGEGTGATRRRLRRPHDRNEAGPARPDRRPRPARPAPRRAGAARADRPDRPDQAARAPAVDRADWAR